MRKKIIREREGTLIAIDIVFYIAVIIVGYLLVDYENYNIVAVEQVEGSTNLSDWKIDGEKKYALILGNEVKGVKQEIIDICDEYLEIPQFGTKHSLNVSCTASIVIWEFFRLYSSEYKIL